MAHLKCVKVPVVLGLGATQHLICTEIPLRPPAFEVKDTEKRVEITQCSVGGVVSTNEKCVAKVIIDAVLKKNINFKTAQKEVDEQEPLQGALESRIICGDLRHCFVKQPTQLNPHVGSEAAGGVHASPCTWSAPRGAIVNALQGGVLW